MTTSPRTRTHSRTPTPPVWASLMPLVWRVPGLGERVAAELFVTPFGQLKESERELPKARGQAASLVGHRRLVATTYGEGRPVFVVHGWGGEGRQMSGFVDSLVERGYQAVVVDLPAHGASEGSQTNVLEASDALLALQREFGAPVGVIAHSFGAAATVLAAQRGLRTEALVFVAPLPSLDVGMKQFAVRAQLPLPVLDRASRRIERSVGLDRRRIDLSAVGAELRLPLLILHDHQDHLVPLHHSRDVAMKWPGSRLVETEGLGHRRILRDYSVVERAVGFLEQGSDGRHSELDGLKVC